MIISGPELSFTLPNCSLTDFLLPLIRAQPEDNIIQVDGESGECLTAGRFLELSLEVAAGLKARGFQLNDVACLVSRNRSTLFPTTLGVIWQGGSAAPIDPSLKFFELKHMFGLLRPKFVFCEPEVVQNVTSALDALKNNALIIIFDSNLPSTDRIINFADLTATGEAKQYTPVTLHNPGTQLAFIIPSSGSTGLPKGVGLTHRSLFFHLTLWINTPRPTPRGKSVYLQVSPFFWMTSVLALLVSIVSKMKRVFVKNINEANTLKAIAKYKPEWVIIVPSALNALVSQPGLRTQDVGSLKCIITGGSPLTTALVERVQKVWGKDVVFFQLYGMTELSGLVTTACPGASVFSVGVLCAGVELKVVDQNTGQVLGPNEVGEFHIRTTAVMGGYVGSAEATKEALDEDGWMHTGDLGYYDNQHCLFIVDRMKEMIKVRNHQVAPGEIEALIETMPGVVEVGVTAIPHQVDMYHPMAVVVKRNNAQLSETDIVEFVKDNMSEYKHLKAGVRFVERLPRTPTGKIRRLVLKELAKSLINNDTQK